MYKCSGDPCIESLALWLLHALGSVVNHFDAELDEEDNEYQLDFIDAVIVFVFDKIAYQGDGTLYFAINQRGAFHRSDLPEMFHELDENQSRGVCRYIIPDDPEEQESFWDVILANTMMLGYTIEGKQP